RRMRCAGGSSSPSGGTSSASRHATRQSTRITMPDPPPYGVSSTLRWRPMPNARGLSRRTRRAPWEVARPTMLVDRKASNSSGNSVTMSTCTSADPIERVEHDHTALDVDRGDVLLHERHLDHAPLASIDEQDLARRVIVQALHGPHHFAGEHHARA